MDKRRELDNEFLAVLNEPSISLSFKELKELKEQFENEGFEISLLDLQGKDMTSLRDGEIAISENKIVFRDNDNLRELGENEPNVPKSVAFSFKVENKPIKESLNLNLVNDSQSINVLNYLSPLKIDLPISRIDYLIGFGCNEFFNVYKWKREHCIREYPNSIYPPQVLYKKYKAYEKGAMWQFKDYGNSSSLQHNHLDFLAGYPYSILFKHAMTNSFMGVVIYKIWGDVIRRSTNYQERIIPPKFEFNLFPSTVPYTFFNNIYINDGTYSKGISNGIESFYKEGNDLKDNYKDLKSNNYIEQKQVNIYNDGIYIEDFDLPSVPAGIDTINNPSSCEFSTFKTFRNLGQVIGVESFIDIDKSYKTQFYEDEMIYYSYIYNKKTLNLLSPNFTRDLFFSKAGMIGRHLVPNENNSRFDWIDLHYHDLAKTGGFSKPSNSGINNDGSNYNFSKMNACLKEIEV